MSEPPILPNAQQHSTLAEENPFAPTSAGVRRQPSIGAVNLSTAYWGLVAAILLLTVVAISNNYFIGWGAAASTIAAAVRVPLLQRTYPRFNQNSTPADPVVLLCTSWALVAVFMFVSCITFAVICVPTSIAFGSPSGFSSSLISWGSSFAAFICFCTLMYLSLRLPL